MKIVYRLFTIVPFYTFLLFGGFIIAYKILDLHIEYKKDIKKLDKEEIELKEQCLKIFKRRAIVSSVIILILAIVGAVLSYLGSTQL